MGRIPEAVTQDWTSIETGRLIKSIGQAHASWPARVFANQMKFNKRSHHDINVAALEALVGSSALIYRGVKQVSRLPFTFHEGFRGSYSTDNEFGSGIYATPDIAYALAYSGRLGALMVFDWSDNAPEDVKKELNDDDWALTVKGCTCFQLAHVPQLPVHDCDIMYGPVSANHDAILTCTAPERSNIMQYMAPTDNGFAVLERRFVGIVYFQM